MFAEVVLRPEGLVSKVGIARPVALEVAIAILLWLGALVHVNMALSYEHYCLTDMGAAKDFAQEMAFAML